MGCACISYNLLGNAWLIGTRDFHSTRNYIRFTKERYWRALTPPLMVAGDSLTQSAFVARCGLKIAAVETQKSRKKSKKSPTGVR